MHSTKILFHIHKANDKINKKGQVKKVYDVDNRKYSQWVHAN